MPFCLPKTSFSAPPPYRNVLKSAFFILCFMIFFLFKVASILIEKNANVNQSGSKSISPLSVCLRHIYGEDNEIMRKKRKKIALEILNVEHCDVNFIGLEGKSVLMNFLDSMSLSMTYVNVIISKQSEAGARDLGRGRKKSEQKKITPILYLAKPLTFI